MKNLYKKISYKNNYFYNIFLNYQFIIWSMQADHDSYFVTIYITTQTIRRIEKEPKKKKKTNYYLTIRST